MTKTTIGNIWCVGRNYAAHAQELNNPIPQKPLIFLKAGTCASTSSTIQLPHWTSDIHHECELAVQLDSDLNPKAFGLALDLTAREVQSQLKADGAPWTLAKSFVGACPLSPLLPWVSLQQFETCTFQLFKNKTAVQLGSPKNMIFSLSYLMSYLKEHFPIAENDLVLTGTPSGVGPIRSGDHLQGIINDSIGQPVLNATWDVN